MRVVITGGTGFVGRKLAARLLADGEIVGPDGKRGELTELVLFDQAAPMPPLPPDRRLRLVTGDIADTATVERLIAPGTASIFHLAAVVSAAAEADLDLGLRVNLDGTRAVLDACRRLPVPPRLLFASSVAIYGGDPPLHVGDLTPPKPRTSYGAQKAAGELLVSDYSRRGLIDGRTARLPTIVVRPGRPNKAASTFASSILREPLSGLPANCPVSLESRMAILSPRRLIECLMRLHDLDGAALRLDRTLLLPGISAGIGEMLAALERAGGRKAADLVSHDRDPVIQKIVDGWPMSLDAPRAVSLGFAADRDIDEIVEAFIADDLPAQKALVAG
ncbi:MAG TPA: D-erythronate dehydrogenase [Aliidongia sp.]|nr:D-erythronate dehydrogenase [Aliidongia sp.]